MESTELPEARPLHMHFLEAPPEGRDEMMSGPSRPTGPGTPPEGDDE